MMPVVRQIDTQHIAPILAISDAAFGAHYLSAADLMGDTGLRGFAAVSDQTVLGFGLAKADSASTTVGGLPNLPSDVGQAIHDKTVGMIQTVAVHAHHRRQGVGEALLLAMEDFLSQRGKRLIIVPAWKNKTGISVDALLSRNAYRPFMLSERYWKESCDRKEFSCPSRLPEDTCGCDAVWYKKTL